MPSYAELITHRLINRERKLASFQGLPPLQWSPKLYFLVKIQSNKMAKVGHVFHAKLQPIQSGECVNGGNGHFPPKTFVRSWMKSPGHRKLLLDPNARTAAVGISSSRHRSYAAWSFSDQPLHPQPQESVVPTFIMRLFFILSAMTAIACVIIFLGQGHC